MYYYGSGTGDSIVAQGGTDQTLQRGATGGDEIFPEDCLNNVDYNVFDVGSEVE